VRQSWIPHDRQQQLTINISTDRARSRERDNFARAASHRISEAILIARCSTSLSPTRHRVRSSLLSPAFAAVLSAPRHPSLACNAYSCGTATPCGLVQHVFSPPARMKRLRSIALPWPPRWAKNALCYAERGIGPVSRSEAKIAKLSAPPLLPLNNEFFLPSAIGRSNARPCWYLPPPARRSGIRSIPPNGRAYS
jgi:hypothetical protein